MRKRVRSSTVEWCSTHSWYTFGALKAKPEEQGLQAPKKMKEEEEEGEREGERARERERDERLRENESLPLPPPEKSESEGIRKILPKEP